MAQDTGDYGSKGIRNRRVHMANERTFLAWIRTSIGIMAFGFVVEKFALFLKRITLLVGEAGESGGKGVPESAHSYLTRDTGYPSIFGVVLIGLGAFIGVLAFIRYKTIERQIDTDSYHPSLVLDIMLVIAVIIIGLFLLVYLTYSL